MSVDFGDVRDELRAVARDVLGKPSAPDWQQLARAGWLGLETSESFGGAGATFAEVAVILEEMGRAATPSPYLGTVVLGVGALNLVQPDPGRDELLRQVASGDLQVAVAMSTDEGSETPFRVQASANGYRLQGQAAFVPDAVDAGRLLVLARDTDSCPLIVPVVSDNPRLAVTPQPLLDVTRRFGVVTADGVEVSEAWRLSGDPESSVRGLFDRATLSIACDSLGLSDAMLDATVAYTGVRQQFGRPIGSFQAVKHACADMLVRISIGRELVSAAVQAVATADLAAAVAVSMAKSYVCSMAVDVAGKTVQLHGGIGYTWEAGIHTYLKRAALNRSLFGSPMAHRKRLARRFVAVGSDGRW
jgi:alkylation response protein AidB-like acyl-CoA dehydrogenase